MSSQYNSKNGVVYPRALLINKADLRTRFKERKGGSEGLWLGLN
jgi:hypothetical protein